MRRLMTGAAKAQLARTVSSDAVQANRCLSSLSTATQSYVTATKSAELRTAPHWVRSEVNSGNDRPRS